SRAAGAVHRGSAAARVALPRPLPGRAPRHRGRGGAAAAGQPGHAALGRGEPRRRRVSEPGCDRPRASQRDGASRLRVRGPPLHRRGAGASRGAGRARDAVRADQRAPADRWEDLVRAEPAGALPRSATGRARDRFGLTLPGPGPSPALVSPLHAWLILCEREASAVAIALYDLSVANYLQGLGAVAGFLEKGLAHFTANHVDLGEIVETRLVPDMLPFRFQLQSVAHHSLGAIEGVKKGLFQPPPQAPAYD